MSITEVKVFPAKDSSKLKADSSRLKAFAAIVLENCFIIRDLKIIEGAKGLFVSMPSRKRKDGTFRDIVHPLNSETRKMIEDRVIDEYHKTLASETVS